jgi:hypothetical protein
MESDTFRRALVRDDPNSSRGPPERSAGEVRVPAIRALMLLRSHAASPDGGIAAPIFWGAALLDAGGCLDHLEIFLGRNVVSFVRD